MPAIFPLGNRIHQLAGSALQKRHNHNTTNLVNDTVEHILILNRSEFNFTHQNSIQKLSEPLAKVYFSCVANACAVGSSDDQLCAYSRSAGYEVDSRGRGILHVCAGRLSRIAGSALTDHLMKMLLIRRNPLGANLF